MVDLTPVGPNGPSAHVIRALSFREFLNPESFARSADDFGFEAANDFRPTGSGAALSMNAIRSFCEQNTLLVGLNPKLARQLREGTGDWARLNGQRTGEIRNASGFAGKATEVGGGIKAVRTAAIAATAFVEIAHLVSSADMARMQRETLNKLGKLESYHDLDREAELEQLYSQARNLLARELDRHEQHKMVEIRSKLHGLRVKWRREVEYNLKQIRDSRNRGWFSSLVSGQERRDADVIEKITAELKKLVLLENTLRLDQMLGLASGTWDLTKATIADEAIELAELSKLLQDKCFYVSDKRREQIIGIQTAFARIPEYYGVMALSKLGQDGEKLLLEFDGVITAEKSN